MEIIMHSDKVTKNAVRYSDGAEEHPKNIYLLKTEVAEMGMPKTIKVTIEPAESTDIPS